MRASARAAVTVAVGAVMVAAAWLVPLPWAIAVTVAGLAALWALARPPGR